MTLQNPRADLRKKEKLPAHFSSECVSKKGIQGSRGLTQLKKSFCIAHFVSVKSFWEVLPQQRFEFRSTVIPKVQEFRKVVKYVLPERDNLFHGECSCPPLCGCPPRPHYLRPCCTVLLRSVWAEQHLSSGVFQFRSLRIAWDAGEGREAGRGCIALALHKHRVQACNFGSKESVNTVEHRKEVGELQLLKNRNKWEEGGGRTFKIINFTAGCLGVHANRNKMPQEHPNTLQANNFPSPFQNLLCVSRCKTSLSLSDTLQPECLCCGWSKSVEQSTWKYSNGSGHWRLEILAGNSYLCRVWSSIFVFLVVRAAMSML